MENQQKWEEFIEELKAIITEAVFASRWAMVEGYHHLGKRIIEEGAETKRVADTLGRSERTIQYAVQFAQKFPDINSLPDGKNISWRKVIALLPDGQKEPTEECNHVWQCVLCGKKK